MEKKRLLTAIITLVVGLFAITQTALAAGPYYFRTTGADPKKPSDWTPNANGIGGTSPVSLGGANIVWNFYNSTGAVTGTCSGNMVLGNGATLNIGNGNADRLNFGAFTVNKAATVHANATVTSSNTNPGFMGAGNFTYNVASTAIFSANNVTVPAPGASTPYGNLTLSGTSATLGAHVIVNGTFTANALVFNGQQLDLNGTVASIGTITGDAGATFNLNGTGSVSITMDQTTPGTTNVFNTLYYNSAGGTLSLTNALNIYPGGTITPAAGTIDVTTSGGSLILLADQVAIGNTGAVGTIGGSFVATSITSQVYHDPTGNQTDWTLLGSPGISGADFTQWNTTFPITCPSCPNGCCVAGTGFTSITSYIENLGSVYTDNAHYVGINNTTDAMTIGQGWWVYMGKSSPSTATAGELIVVSGTPNQGAFSYNVTSTAQGSGYNLLANPYPSPVSWTSVYNNNAGNLSSSSYATWSPNYGGYVYYDGFTNTPNPSGTSYDLSDVVPISMGFYIQSSNGTAISFAETDKTQGTQPLLRQSSSSVANTTHVKCTVSASGSTGASEATVVFNASSTAGLDNFIDTKRFAGNSGRLEVSCPVGGFDLAINGMPALTQNYHIPVKMVTGGAGTTGTFSIGAKNLKYMPSGACIMLHDNYTNANYDLRNGPYNITLNDTENVARFVLNVSTATLSLTGSAKQASCPASHDGYITAIGNSAGPWNYTWKNASGNIIKTTSAKAGADTLTGLNSGVYSVDVNTVGSCDNAAQSFTLTAPAPTSLNVTASSKPASCATANDAYIVAVGNSAGPWNYTWKDASNTIVKTTLNKTTADTLQGLNGGNYSVQINTAGTCDLGSQNFSLAVPNAPVSGFSTPSSTVYVNSSLPFTNSSIDASNYWWTFGDGGNSSLQDPNYTYTALGSYTVTLYAYNPACNDTSSTQQVITVMATTGIASGVVNADVMVLKDQNGTPFIKFNYNAQTKVNINVYNALGQALLVSNNQLVSNDKIYINIENAKDQLIFISVANLEKNTTVTKKFFNN